MEIAKYTVFKYTVYINGPGRPYLYTRGVAH